MRKVIYNSVGNSSLRLQEGSVFQVVKETPKTLVLLVGGKEFTFTNCKDFFTEIK
jgi:hypothetical protein